jgi:glyoxylase-like metal-dependent hydrolase (beta-lactamase superfamily II)
VLELSPDQTFEDGATLPGGLRAVKIAGTFAGDTVLVWEGPTGEHALFTGDTLNGAFDPESPRPHPRRSQPGLYIGAGAPYLRNLDAAALKDSLRPFTAGSIDVICGAHGQPWRDDPQGTLARLIDLDWGPYLAQDRHPVVTGRS